MKTHALISTIIVATVLSSCSTLYVSSVQTRYKTENIISEKPVQIYLGEHKPAYEEIGFIQVLVPEYYADDIGEVVKKAERKAIKMGADCLVLTDLKNLNENRQQTVITAELIQASEESIFPHKYIFIAGRLK